ncbi:MAG: GNAT family N-acetyltransferase [Treponema sp.]|nr:GNAT family N-acetyltransferase [Treponema sp.]
MIVNVDLQNIDKAAFIHSISWKESHRSFCQKDFIELHSTAHQKEYLLEKINKGTSIYMLIENIPVGIVSITNSLIEDLYVLPDYQNKGYGTKLLTYAIKKCNNVPTLWILENNEKAARLYKRIGFRESGNKKIVKKGLNEIEYSFKPLEK